jgi:hypothetical protein
MATVRVKQGVAASVYNPATETREILVPGKPYDTDDPFVKEFAWAFESDVEQATAAPGEKRTTSRRK